MAFGDDVPPGREEKLLGEISRLRRIVKNSAKCLETTEDGSTRVDVERVRRAMLDKMDDTKIIPGGE